MAKRKSKNTIEDLLKLLILVSVIAGYYFTGSFKTGFILALITLVLFFIVYIYRNTQKTKRLKQSGIYEIDKMDGFQFENYLKILYTSHGYKVIKTPDRKDFGADLILEKDGKRIVVQAKRYSKNVGIKAIQEVQASMPYYKANEAWVLTNSEFTSSAKQLAHSANVQLIGREKLISLMLKLNPNKEVANPQKFL